MDHFLGDDWITFSPLSAGGIGGWSDTLARIRSNLDKVTAGRGNDVTIAMRAGDYQPG